MSSGMRVQSGCASASCRASSSQKSSISFFLSHTTHRFSHNRFQGRPTIGGKAPYNAGVLAPPARVLVGRPSIATHRSHGAANTFSSIFPQYLYSPFSPLPLPPCKTTLKPKSPTGAPLFHQLGTRAADLTTECKAAAFNYTRLYLGGFTNFSYTSMTIYHAVCRLEPGTKYFYKVSRNAPSGRADTPPNSLVLRCRSAP